MSDLQCPACRSRDDARKTRAIQRDANSRAPLTVVCAALDPLRAPIEYTYTVRSRKRSRPRDGIAQASTRRTDDDREAVQVYRTQPRTRLDRARGKIDATQLGDRRDNGCKRGGVRAKHFATAARCGRGEERAGAGERRSRA